jgi:hypothetical protein
VAGAISIDLAPVSATIYDETPLVRIALPPGRHFVHATTRSGVTRDVWTTIESDKVARARRIEW